MAILCQYLRCLSFRTLRVSLYSRVSMEIHKFLVFFYRKESLHTLVHLCIFLANLKTRRCVLIVFSRYRSPCTFPIRLTGCLEYSRTFRYELVAACETKFNVGFILSSPFSSAGGAEIQKAANKAQMADVKQMETIVPLMTCEIALCVFVEHFKLPVKCLRDLFVSYTSNLLVQTLDF